MYWKSIILCSLLLFSFTLASKKTKKDIRDFTDADLEKLYEEWEENDEDELPDDEKPEHLRPKQQLSFEELQKQAKSPDDMMRLSKKGQSVMMFVSVIDPSGAAVTKDFADKITGIWHSNLYNNHIDVQVYNTDVDRALFLFKDGTQAWEAKEFLLKQKECKEITLEGQNHRGAGVANNVKREL